MSIEQIAYKAAPKLDEAAATALRYTERGLEPALTVAGAAQRAGSFALDVINPQREDERAVLNHLRKRVSQIVLVGGYEEMEPSLARRTADSLLNSGVVDAGTIVGIRPLVHREPINDQLRLHQSAELLHATLRSKDYDIASFLVAPEDPARIAGYRLRADAIHAAIYRADDEYVTGLNDRLSDHWQRDDVSPRVRTLIVANPELTAHLNGVRHQDLANGGLAWLAAARKRAKHRWAALKRAPLAAVQTPTEEQPTIELPAEAPQMELDFPIPTGRRFVRSDDLRPANQRERERRI
jgi:hypothetical protein